MRIIAWSTFTVWAMFAMRSRSAWRWKPSKCSEATSASRTVFCWYRNPGFVPGSTFHQVPHSSNTRPTFLCGSWRSMTVAWRATSSSARTARERVRYHSWSLNSVALPLSSHGPDIV